jgi:hypothetical protein
MGSRPSSDIIYGFVYTYDWRSEEDDQSEDFDDLRDKWNAKVYLAAGINPEDYDFKAKNEALREAGELILWGATDDGDPSYAFGFKLISGDWEAATDIGVLAIPNNADEKLREIAEFFGINSQPGKLLLLTSYG